MGIEGVVSKQLSLVKKQNYINWEVVKLIWPKKEISLVGSMFS